MAVFFFVVGLEIKREVLVGELSTARKAALPILAAFGGMLVPALIYLSLNASTERAVGWGIPVATDIAFALGILMLLGRRAPLGLRIFLTALAIADDLAAVLVIALFYTAALHWAALGWAAALLAVLFAANWAGVRHPGVYAVLGIGLWFAVLESGVHATVAGVLLALTIPARSRIDTEAFAARSRALVDGFAEAQQPGSDVMTNARQLAAIREMEAACEQASPPLERMMHALHTPVMFLIMPVFAFFNAAVVIEAGFLRTLAHPATLGVLLGLVVGKPIGIVAFSWLAVRLRVADMPEGVSWRQMVGVGCLGGVGFTMSLFINGLAFDGALLTAAKTGILMASLTAGVIGYAMLRSTPAAAT